MAHKTFISYKFSEAQDLRNRIISAMGENAQYYKGETSDSPDLTDTTTENIKKNLTDMMYDTSVTIVILSPNMIKSKWIPWEIEYTLKEIKRKGRTSRRNGIVGVIMKVNSSYSWFKSTQKNSDGCTVSVYQDEKLPINIQKLRYNQSPQIYNCNKCKCVDQLTGSYMSFVEEDEFLSDIDKFIDNAYDKSENNGSGYSFKND